MCLPEGGGGVSSGVPVLEDEPARAAHGELLGDVEDGVGQTFLQSFLVLLLDGVVPAEHLVEVNGLVELDHRAPLEGREDPAVRDGPLTALRHEHGSGNRAHI